MEFQNGDVGGIFEQMLVDPTPVSAQDRATLADMYRCIVTADPNWKACLEQNDHLLDVEFYLEHTTSCSCGRFFEQHPTTVDGVAEEELERMLTQVLTGSCSCLVNSDPDTTLVLSHRRASKTLLHAAAASGYRSDEIVQYLLHRGCMVNKTTALFSYTPLFRAICSKNMAVIRTLLSRDDINVNMRSRSEQLSPLLEAISQRLYPVVDLLLAVPHINLDVRNFRQETPVIVATRMGDLHILTQLLTLGADPNLCDQRGLTPLLYAIKFGFTNILRLLLSYGPNLNLNHTSRGNPLVLAVSVDSLEMTQLLLEAGAHTNDTAPDSYPPLTAATYNDNVNIARLLLEHGANVHYSNEMGYQAVHIAAWNGYTDLLTLLLEHGAAPDQKTHDYNTPLSLAAHGNHETVVELLMEKGCDINNKDKDLDTPLHYATFNGNLSIVEKFVERGADPGVLNRLHVTPLWNAVYTGSVGLVQFLIKKNVALDVPSRGILQNAQSTDVVTVFDTPRSPLWVAADRGHSEIALLLLTAGCNVARESWIGLDEFPGESNTVKELKDVLTYYYTVPRPLTFQCRIFLRRMAGSNVRKFVRRLPLPEKHKKFLTLSDAFD